MNNNNDGVYLYCIIIMLFSLLYVVVVAVGMIRLCGEMMCDMMMMCVFKQQHNNPILHSIISFIPPPRKGDTEGLPKP